MKAYIYKQSIKDRAVAEASVVLSHVTGLPQAMWGHILKWRVRYWRGDLSRALRARTVEGEVVFDWPTEMANNG